MYCVETATLDHSLNVQFALNVATGQAGQASVGPRLMSAMRIFCEPELGKCLVSGSQAALTARACRGQ